MNTGRNMARGRRIVRAGVALCLALGGFAATASLAACAKKDETPSVALTVMCTDEVRRALADAEVTDAQGFLQAAAAEFAAQYTDARVTINVLPMPEGWSSAADVVSAYVNDVVVQGTGEVVPPVPASAPVPPTPPAPEAGTDTQGDEGTQGEEPAEGEGEAIEGDTESDGDAEGDAEGEGAEGEGAEGEEPSAAGPSATASLEDPASASPATTPEPSAAAPAPAPAAPASAGTSAIPTRPFEGGFSTSHLPHADVLFGAFTDLTPLVYAGKALPLDDVLTSQMLARIPAHFLAEGTAPANGKTYLLPFSASQQVLVINAALFEECGLSEFVAPVAAEGSDAEAEAAAAADDPDAPITPALPATAEAAADVALSAATLRVWSPQEWAQVIATLSDALPRLAMSRDVDAGAAWTEAYEAINGEALAAEEEARKAAEAREAGETVEDPTPYDLNAALEALGPKPELTPLYPFMLAGAGADGAEFAVALMRMMGASLLDERGCVQLENEAGIAAATLVSLMAQRGAFPENADTLTYEDCATLFANGQLAMMLIDTKDIHGLFVDAAEEFVPEPAEGEGEEGEGEGEVAPEGEATTPVTPAPAGYVLTKDYAFVALPAWSTAAYDAVYAQWTDADEAAEGGEDAEAEEAVAEEDEGEGEGAEETVDPVAAALVDNSRSIIPTELYGFAVLDNGDDLAAAVAKDFVQYVLTSATWQDFAACSGQVPADTFVYHKFVRDLLFGDDLRAQLDSMSDESCFLPAWRMVKAAFNETLAEALAENKTPVETVAALDKACNVFIEPAYRAAGLHE